MKMIVCFSCGFKFDIKENYTDENETVCKCPKCGSYNYVGY